ncbi:TlpA family protein disulfide reductase [Desulfovermiculus halophilus]|uniref:TlpA family protein disulfide reductase n=1 Tax=Desulfovermiculus halophilus TaxID=339722 RepID=UPI000482A824|nr:TlpA disulfide reductase family protein [Desulfovermiculus halophilus]
MRTAHYLLIGLILIMALTSEVQAATVGNPAPKFEITTLDGREVDLQSYADQGPLLLFFWTTWCRYCADEMRAIEDLKDEYGPQGLQILGINPGWRDSERRAEAFRRREKLDLALAFDQSMRLGSTYMLQGVPTLFLVDTQGTVAYRGHGITSRLRTALDRMLSES